MSHPNEESNPSDTYEARRLEALHRLDLLDTAPTEAFDRITRMAAQIFNLPISAVSLTDADRQWFKSRVGVAHDSIPRDKAPCSHVADTAGVVVIPDLLDDACYRDSPLAESGIRFYAGAPLITDDGYSLGAMCVLGTEPRQTTPEEMASLHDLAAMAMAQIELQHALGRIDPVSGLPNRKQFREDFDDLNKDGKGIEARVLVMVNFAKPEEIRDGTRAMGSHYFEDLIRHSVTLLRSILGKGRTIYHVGEAQVAFFARQGIELQAYSRELAQVLQQQRHASNASFMTTTSVGIAPFLLGQTGYADVLRMAHSACQEAFEMDEHVCVYSTEHDAAHLRRFTLLNKFSSALEHTERLSLVYQPRIDIASGACVGAEALLRWTDPDLGPVSPGEFMPIVELSSMARPVTAWLMETAIRQLRQWQDDGIDMQVSLNVSATNLLEPDFAERLLATLTKYQVAPQAVELELTESAFMSNPGKAQATLTAVADAGVRLAIDDFGTGYSSLSYLQSLPADIVKIDQSFIRKLFEGERARMLVGAMVSLSHELGYRVVAEGVETQEALDFLRKTGCDEVQGYLFAKPMPPESLVQWLAQQQVSEAA
ncbi:EAL domain-containing protein (putative c-di-GMP-specific phosphodiesterase class I) [Paucimonas lemoignei]|uniref:EAL domain-containing protein (Putative c-di-GMP-specific phosphodiesterase class I) n=1 Tax=Paucimonas lemoignei TaxID=29443 RepID=A0A4R3HU25_PAULE|nr:GGDEF and EAL domain-containing protein [Paucimonas lemoignei]TCS35163.1 EAL domain-containing protein (putative c-di-GMP-specific phosphodiesterase class I) [Paucimonas lemoignei]